MKLYEAPCKSHIRLLEDVEGPVSAWKPNEGEEYIFNHIDGMYSLCYDMDGKIIHIPAWAEVELVKEKE